jgi:ubiquinone/menaquinone biosynthesis C-methylase UbiE
VQKALKIIAVMEDFAGGDLSQLNVLDVGGSAGVMTEVFADSFSEVIELDIDDVAVRNGRDNCASDNVRWLCGDGTHLPFADGSFDCVICNHVYEHVDDHRGLVAEIERVLKPDGFCYWSAGSRFVLVEGHYKLPFLSWLPHRLSDLYMKLAGRKGGYDVTLLSYRNLRKLLRPFKMHDYTIPILKEPLRFAADDLKDKNRLAFKIPTSIYRLCYPLLPIWIWILTKKG